MREPTMMSTAASSVITAKRFQPPSAQASAARQLTELLEQHTGFSFIRIGDGEVHWMHAAAQGQLSQRYSYSPTPDSLVETARGVSGMELRHWPRFQHAVYDCDYVDFCDSIPKVRDYLSATPVPRRPGTWRNPSPDASNLIFAWTYLELGPYLQRHRCLFAGAEASLLGALWSDPEYRACAQEVIPLGAEAFFHQVRDDGRRYSENLDLIKADLIAAIQATRADTLLLALGTGAKILCPEIAQACRVRAVDIGSMLRALSYAGSPGYLPHRGMHHPFFFHVPFDVHTRALEQAFAHLPLQQLAGKAYAQLALELHPHEPFRFNTTEGVAGGQLELSAENLASFRTAWRAYRRDFWPRWKKSPEVARLDRDFRHWLRKQGIGWEGFVFLKLVAGKRWLRRLHLVR